MRKPSFNRSAWRREVLRLPQVSKPRPQPTVVRALKGGPLNIELLHTHHTIWYSSNWNGGLNPFGRTDWLPQRRVKFTALIVGITPWNLLFILSNHYFHPGKYFWSQTTMESAVFCWQPERETERQPGERQRETLCRFQNWSPSKGEWSWQGCMCIIGFSCSLFDAKY